MRTFGSRCNRTKVGCKFAISTGRIEGPFLIFEDVQRGPAEPSTFQCVEQSLRIEERSPPSVDNEGAWLHLADPLTIQEVVGLPP